LCGEINFFEFVIEIYIESDRSSSFLVCFFLSVKDEGCTGPGLISQHTQVCHFLTQARVVMVFSKARSEVPNSVFMQSGKGFF